MSPSEDRTLEIVSMHKNTKVRVYVEALDLVMLEWGKILLHMALDTKICIHNVKASLVTTNQFSFLIICYV